MFRRQLGFTMIEIAIVITIVGFILFGVLKGQSLIQNSRVHSTIQMQSQTVAAFNAFVDRYQALPGDYASASSTLNCGGVICLDGNGNGRIEASAHEDLLVWTHLTAANFYSGSYIYDGVSSANQTNTPVNAYGAFVNVSYSNNFGNNTGPLHHVLQLGNMIPSDILAEVDRKIDDGNPLTGSFQFSTYTGTDAAPDATQCLANGSWNVSSASNCGAAWIIR